MGIETRAVGAARGYAGQQQEPSVDDLKRHLDLVNAQLKKPLAPRLRIVLEAKKRDLEKAIARAQAPRPPPQPTDERAQVAQELDKTNRALASWQPPSIKIQLEAKKRGLEARLAQLDHPPAPAPAAQGPDPKDAARARIAEIDRALSGWFLSARISAPLKAERRRLQAVVDAP